MKISINKEAIHKIQQQIMQKIKSAYQLAQSMYQKSDKRQRGVLLIIGAVIPLLLLMILSSAAEKGFRQKSAHPIQFETQATYPHPATVAAQAPLQPVTSTNNTHLQKELDQLKAVSHAQYSSVNDQLQAIQLGLSNLASQQDMQQLQKTVAQPDTKLQRQMSHLQQSIERIAQQTEQKTWVNPKSVEPYFRLVAVQGFSDGMRAIIDIDGNQTTLSIKQICPACRSWVLQSMNFAQQQAVFSKQVGNHMLYVKLRAN